YHLNRRAAGRAGSIAALSVAVVGSALTKVASLSALLPYAGLDLLSRTWRRLRPAHVAMIGVAGLIVAGYIGLMLWTYLPMYLTAGQLGPKSWHYLQANWTTPARFVPVLARDLGLIVLLIALVQSRPHAPRAASGIRSVPATLTATLLAVVFGSASFFLMPYLNVIGYVTAIWLVILALLDRAQMLERARGWWIAAAGLLLIYPLSQDPAGLSAGVAWLAAVGGIAWIALTIRPAEAFAYRAALLPRRFAWWT